MPSGSRTLSSIEPDHYFVLGFLPSAHSKDWVDYEPKILADTLISDESEPLNELLLGIEKFGHSYLLLPKSTSASFLDSRGLICPTKPPIPASKYLSLSPITFSTHAALLKKLQDYKLKSSKSGLSGDTSSANRYYEGAKNAEDGRTRAMFEHSRLLFHLLQHLVKAPTFRYGITNISKWSCTKIVSLTFNTWEHSRDRDELLDIGWSTVTFDPSNNLVTCTDSVHLVWGVNQMKYTGTPFLHGQGEVLQWPNLIGRLQTLLASATAELPLVLLVYDLEATTSILNLLQTPTNTMHTGLAELLYPKQAASRADMRARSRSPRRNSRDPRSRPRSPPRPPVQFQPIYLLDVRELYHTMSHTPDPNRNSSYPTVLLHTFRGQEFRRIASALGVQVPDLTEGCCAGNESHALAQMWLSLACGEPVDEQDQARREGRHPPLFDVSNLSAAAADEDEDIDPADLPRVPMQNVQQQNPNAHGDYGYNMDSWDDDAEDEY